MHVDLLTFNIGYSKTFANGPGISCWNFVKFCKSTKFNIYSKLESDLTFNVRNYKKFNSEADIFHWWSGDNEEFLAIALAERKKGKKIILGPNLFDATNPKRELEICKALKPDLILVVNNLIRSQLRQYINHKIEVFMTGPDYDLWVPSNNCNGRALWKGNHMHASKGFLFCQEIKKDHLNLDILGYPYLYRYPEHIKVASEYSCYVSTSLTETKSEAVLEQLAAGVPAITHPGVYISGVNYKTGIICERSLLDYSKAITRILGDKELRDELSMGAREYILTNFKKETLDSQYETYIR